MFLPVYSHPVFFDEDIPGLRCEDTYEDFLDYKEADRDSDNWEWLYQYLPVQEPDFPQEHFDSQESE